MAPFLAGDFEIYCETVFINLNAILNKEILNDKDLHAIRKLLKDLFYNSGEYAKALDSNIPKEEGIAIPGALLEKLGDFQDLCTAISFLQPDRTAGLGVSTTHSLNNIKETLLQQKDELFQELQFLCRNLDGESNLIGASGSITIRKG